jgi:asparagine synthase (glutamine-hydrolysing)
MCGIAGILNLDGQPCNPDDVRLFTDALAHRGPDGRGVFTDGPIGLGHRRLAILDLSEQGKQPMPCLDGRYLITYNGEVYNFLELRRELEETGLTFKTESDTEVIVAAYHHWGADCVFRFNGMWAFAIWDTERRELFLSRDRFGIKPLRYMADSRRFAFASELKAFFHLPGFTAREDEREMHFALAKRAESTEETLVLGVKRLPGGHNMLVSAEGMRIWRWWRTYDHLPAVPRRLSDQAEQFREMFFDAVRLRLRSDVPVASCLSGGLDSSSIVCALPEMARLANERQSVDFHQAFVATFPGTPWDEREYAEAAIVRGGANAHMVPIEVDTVIENLHQYAYDFEMVGTTLLMPLWLTYRALRRQGIVVSLDGHGSDEILAGYARTYNDWLATGPLMRAPLRTLDLIRTVNAMYTRGAIDGPSFTDLVINSDPFLRAGRRVVRRGARLARRIVRAGMGRGFRSVPFHPEPPWVAPCDQPLHWLDDEDKAAQKALGPFTGSLYKLVHGTVLPSVLRKFDRCSMAHGVEIRMPFLDWRLVCYAFALPDESKGGGGFSKRVLREAMRGVLPEKIRTRKPKIGFGSPLPNWFNGPLGAWVWNEVQSPAFVKNERWNGPAIRDFVGRRHRSKSWTFEDCETIWRFLQAHLWLKAYFG